MTCAHSGEQVEPEAPAPVVDGVVVWDVVCLCSRARSSGSVGGRITAAKRRLVQCLPKDVSDKTMSLKLNLDCLTLSVPVRTS